MNGERRPIGEHLTLPREDRVKNAMIQELERLRFITCAEGETAAIQFAARTCNSYRHAYRRGMEYRKASDKSRVKNGGYGLEYKYEMIGSILVFKYFLKQLGVQPS